MDRPREEADRIPEVRLHMTNVRVSGKIAVEISAVKWKLPQLWKVPEATIDGCPFDGFH